MEAEKKGFFSKMLDAALPPIEDKKPVVSSTPSGTSKPAAPAVNTSPAVNIDMGMYTSIKEALKSRGRVFNDFMEKTEAMKSIIPDEVSRIKATVIAMSVSKEALSSAINEIRTGLTVEKGEFNAEIEKASKINIALTANIQTLDKQIIEQQNKINELIERKSAMEEDLKVKTEKVETTIAVFEATIATISGEIDSLESKLSYI